MENSKEPDWDIDDIKDAFKDAADDYKRVMKEMEVANGDSIEEYTHDSEGC